MKQYVWWRDPILWVGIFTAVVAAGYWYVTRPKPYLEPSPTALVSDPPPATAYASAQDLLAADPPVRDLTALTRHLRGIDAPLVAPDVTAYQPQAVASFWVKDQNNDTNRQIQATLIYQSEALNFWVEDGARVRQDVVTEAARQLEQNILPTTRAFFGEEWRPGVDNDARVNILHVKEIGGGPGAVAGGYFSSADEYVTQVNPYSNQREMFYISLKEAPVGSQSYYEVIAHEMQHMIQWHVDRNEVTWLDEGLSELSTLVNGMKNERHIPFTQRPDVQLTAWSQDASDALEHVGASYLFAAYFWERFGQTAMQRLVQHPENGVAGVEATLREIGAGLSFNDLFADWVTANYLSGRDLEQGVYQYTALTIPEMPLAADWRQYPVAAEAAVHQYGTDYVLLRGEEPVTLTFTGTQQVNLLEAMPHSGAYYWTTTPADRSDMALTRAFDLSGLDKASLTFWSWYDIEAGWDYGFVAVSADNGATWTLLPTNATTTNNPQGNSFGPGLTGLSGDGVSPIWSQQTADLTPFAGQTILVRFEYITDDAVVRPGWAIDDVAIPELGYAEDFEQGPGDWTGAGFVHHTNILPQSFLLQAITLHVTGQARVTRLPLDAQQGGAFQLALSPDTPQIVLAISGLTPVTTQRATYVYRVTTSP